MLISSRREDSRERSDKEWARGHLGQVKGENS
jgi:hypothetical protein